MRGSPNRQTVSSTARWNMGQSSPGFSPGAQKDKIRQRDTGQGSNIVNLKRILARAQEHYSQTYGTGIQENIKHGIMLIQAQLLRMTGQDPSAIDLNTVPDLQTGYQFAGDPFSDDYTGTNVIASPVDQSIISPLAIYQLFGTLRQKITKVQPPTDATPGGSLKWQPPATRTSTVKSFDNPTGSIYPVGVPAMWNGLRVEVDMRMQPKGTGQYIQGRTISVAQRSKPLGRGLVTSQIIPRGKAGTIRGGSNPNP